MTSETKEKSLKISSMYDELKGVSSRRLVLTINDNRSTMLSVKWESEKVHVSLHRFFLNAPQAILEALKHYIQRKNRTPPAPLKAFIEENVKKLNYSYLLDQKELDYRGEVFDLLRLYRQLNRTYFDNKLALFITWYGRKKTYGSSKVTLGQYCAPLRLIKVHRRLDNILFPDFVLSFVVYHEMLHAACPPLCEMDGSQRIHSAEFKKREQNYLHYHKAKEWLQTHHHLLFSLRGQHVWS